MIERIREELDDVRALAAEASVASLRDGSWLVSALRATVDDYTTRVDLPSLLALHPNLETEALADARIGDAQWRATIAGGASAGAYATVVLASLATGTFVGAALPAAVAAFAVDLYYQARLQVCLAWDLALIYGHPLDPRDDDDLWTLTRVAFGVDDAAPTADLAKPAVPLASRFGSRAISTGARLAIGVQAVGRTIALRSVAKFAIPAVGVPLCASVNHITTGAVGRAARRIFRDRAAGRTLAGELASAEELVVAAVLLMLRADQRLDSAEVALLAAMELDPAAASGPAALLGLDERALVARIRSAHPELRHAAVAAARAAAELDGSVHADEQALLDLL